MKIQDDGHLGLGTVDLNHHRMSQEGKDAMQQTVWRRSLAISFKSWARMEMAKELLGKEKLDIGLFSTQAKIAASFAALAGHRVTFAQPGQLVPVVGLTEHGTHLLDSTSQTT